MVFNCGCRKIRVNEAKLCTVYFDRAVLFERCVYIVVIMAIISKLTHLSLICYVYNWNIYIYSIHRWLRLSVKHAGKITNQSTIPASNSNGEYDTEFSPIRFECFRRIRVSFDQYNRSVDVSMNLTCHYIFYPTYVTSCE